MYVGSWKGSKSCFRGSHIDFTWKLSILMLFRIKFWNKWSVTWLYCDIFKTSVFGGHGGGQGGSKSRFRVSHIDFTSKLSSWILFRIKFWNIWYVTWLCCDTCLQSNNWDVSYTILWHIIPSKPLRSQQNYFCSICTIIIWPCTGNMEYVLQTCCQYQWTL